MVTTFAGHHKDKCGFGCKFKKSMSKIGTNFQQSMYERKEKKAKSYGYDSYTEFSKAAKAAEKRGYTKAGKRRLKEIEDRAAGSKNIAGGTSNLAKGISLFDEFMGTKPPQRRTNRKKSAKKPSYSTKRAAPKRRRPQKEEPFFTF